jgi:hypothetical protein
MNIGIGSLFMAPNPQGNLRGTTFIIVSIVANEVTFLDVSSTGVMELDQQAFYDNDLELIVGIYFVC